MQKIIRAYIEEKKLWEIIDLKKNYKISFLAQGEYNKNYVINDDCHKYVFRINFGSQISVANQIEYEFMTLRCLENSGVTPRVFFVDSSQKNFPKGLLIMEYLEGVPLNYQKDIDKAAFIFGKIHAIRFEKEKHQDFIVEKKLFSDRLQEAQTLLKNVWEAPVLDKQVKLIFEKFFDNLAKHKKQEKFFEESNLCLNNTEVNSQNFIIGKKNSYLVDWEKAVFSDVCQDLCHFLAPTTTLWKADYFLSPKEQNYFIQCYCKQNHFFSVASITQRIALYNPYLYLRALSWCAFAYVEYHGRELVNQDTYRKITQYLEVGFLEKLLKKWLI